MIRRKSSDLVNQEGPCFSGSLLRTSRLIMVLLANSVGIGVVSTRTSPGIEAIVSAAARGHGDPAIARDSGDSLSMWSLMAPRGAS